MNTIQPQSGCVISSTNQRGLQPRCGSPKRKGPTRPKLQLNTSIQPPTAFAALIRPPLDTFPFNERIGSTDFKSFARKSLTGRFGFCERISAATPETNGVAMDVPFNSLKSCSSQVLKISSPGAATCTDLAP